MAGINTQKVVVGGLAAGLVMNVIDFITNMFILQDRMKAELEAVNPQLWANMNDMGQMPIFIGIDFLLGIVLVWLYAAIRPRFGPGSGTALKAAVYVWLVATFMWYFFVAMGVTTLATYTLGSAIALVNFILSAYVGGLLYTEAG